jgi:hypothetical protein
MPRHRRRRIRKHIRNERKRQERARNEASQIHNTGSTTAKRSVGHALEDFANGVESEE